MKQNFHLFNDIVKGYSQSEYLNQPICIKHLDNDILGEYDRKYCYYYKKAENLPSEDEQIKYLKENGFWVDTESREEELKKKLKRVRATLSNLFRRDERADLKKEIAAAEAELDKIEQDRNELMGITRENFASRKANEVVAFRSFFTDSSLSCPFFSPAAFDELEDKELLTIFRKYREVTESVSDRVIQIISIESFFQNLFSFCDNIYNFYGLPIVKLTNYQVKLYYYGSIFKNILQEYETSIPESIQGNPEEILEWYEGRKSIEKLNKDAASIVGLNPQDAKFYGIQAAAQPQVDLGKKAIDNGGTLNLQDLMSMNLI